MYRTLKYLREQKNFSQQYIASYLDISRQMYIKYEQGEVEPSVKAVIMLSKLYNVSYDAILDSAFSDPQAQNEATLKTSVHKKTSDFYTQASVSTTSNPTAAFSKFSPLQTIMPLLPKLTYAEQLQLLATLCDQVKTAAQSPSNTLANLQTHKKVRTLKDELGSNS